MFAAIVSITAFLWVAGLLVGGSGQITPQVRDGAWAQHPQVILANTWGYQVWLPIQVHVPEEVEAVSLRIYAAYPVDTIEQYEPIHASTWRPRPGFSIPRFYPLRPREYVVQLLIYVNGQWERAQESRIAIVYS